MAIIPPALRKKIFGKGKAPAESESESASDEALSSEAESGEEASASDAEEKAPAKGGKSNPLKKWAAARMAAGAKG